MKRILIAFLYLSFFSACLSAQQKKIVILHTNDMHSRLNGFAPESYYTPLSVNDDKTIGGFARIASVIKAERLKKDQITIVIDAGDFLMGTLFHAMEEGTGFQLPLMKRMGYDVVAIGNHEFDFGPDVLGRIIDKSVSVGAIPQVIMGNAVFSSSDPADDRLEELNRKGIIKQTFILETGGLKIGFFSLLGKNASFVAPKSKPVTFKDQQKFSKEAVGELRSKGCDLVICVSHSGVWKGKDGKWGGEDIELASKVRGIDVVISGHTHTLLEKPVVSGGIPVVQAGEYGEYIGKLTLKGDKSGFRTDSYEMIKIDDSIHGDAKTDSAIRKQEDNITAKILSKLKMDYSEPLVENTQILDCDPNGDLDESNLGPLLADAIHWYLNSHSSGGVDMSMISSGVIRDRMMPGVQSAADLFRIVPLGSGKDSIPDYPLARLYVTGRELKNILEVLLVARKSNPDYHCFFSGIKAEYDPGKGLLKKVKSIEVVHPGGTAEQVDFSKHNPKLYSVAANSYMLEFIGIIKKKTHGLVNVVPKDHDGKKVTDMTKAIVDVNEKIPGVQEGKEWLALVEYLRQMKDLNGNSLPDLDPVYYKAVKTLTIIKKN